MPNVHASSNWQSLGANGYTGAYTTTGGGGTPVSPRSNLDYQRMGMGRAPEAEYPDGYLGTIRSRRDDRGRPTDTVLDSLKARSNQRAYQRGVHKGERIDPGQYMWPKELAPDRRLRQAARAERIVNDGGINYMVDREAPDPQLTPPPALVNDGKANVSANIPGEIYYRESSLRNLRPSWS